MRLPQPESLSLARIAFLRGSAAHNRELQGELFLSDLAVEPFVHFPRHVAPDLYDEATLSPIIKTLHSAPAVGAH